MGAASAATAFALVSSSDGHLEALNGAGAVPRALATASIPGGTLPRFGPLSISTPGLVEAWWRLWQRYGTLPFPTLIEPAAVLADDGFALDHAFARALDGVRAGVDGDDPFVSEFCEGNGTAEGDGFRLASLARTLREIAAGGPPAFYEGRIAREIVGTVDRLGGLLAGVRPGRALVGVRDADHRPVRLGRGVRDATGVDGLGAIAASAALREAGRPAHRQ